MLTRSITAAVALTALRPSAVVLVTIALTTAVGAAQHEHRAPARADTVARRDAARRDLGAAGAPMADGHAAHVMMAGPLGISHTRMGSGTSWLPDSSPMHANHQTWGDWTVMLHGVAFGVYDYQGTRRGADQLGVIDWEMVMAMRRVGSGVVHLHGMASLEPATIGAKGYPLLLQTGESYKGRPLVDRQHPHDLFMELAAMYERPVARDLAVSLYGGAAGEPALGPVAFMHRPSAQSDPFSPLGHHWQDATHISYGVATAGLYSRWWKLEGSVFNGREPDENRWDLDFGRLDSYSGRLTVNPTGRWSLAGWYGFLKSPEALHPEESTHRYGASALYSGRGWWRGEWATLLMWGANAHGGRAENSAVLESNLEVGRNNTLFTRAEYVRKSAEDLGVADVPPGQEYDINSVIAGYIREIGAIPDGTIGVGFRASVNLVPRALEPTYGTRTPAGVAVYVRVRPRRMVMGGGMPGMPGMQGTPTMPGMSGNKVDTSGHRMPMARDTLLHAPHDTTHAMHEMPTRRDSTPGMQPGMRMTQDSVTGMRDSPAMPHDSAAVRPPADTGMTRMEMQRMGGGSSRTAVPHDTAAAPPRKPSTGAMPSKARRGVTRGKARPVPRSRASSSGKRPAAAARKKKPAPPHHDMPGMKMGQDSTTRPPAE